MRDRQDSTAKFIGELARQHEVRYLETASDALAHHITRLAGDSVAFDAVEQTLLALQRAGHLSRRELVRLQARYLRESKQ